MTLGHLASGVPETSAHLADQFDPLDVPLMLEGIPCRINEVRLGVTIPGKRMKTGLGKLYKTWFN